MQARYLSVAFSLVLASAFGRTQELDLAGVWRLSGSDREGRMVACPIPVPGDVHSALLAARVIPDVYQGCNETQTLWVARRDWLVSRSFDITDEFLKSKEIVLRLEDCETFCTIKVNGNFVGKTTDRFQRYTFDVKPYLKRGVNTIEARFESPVREADARRIAEGRAYPISNVIWAKNQALIRKPACHGGWDWGPEIEVMGLCGTVKLLANDTPRIDYVYTRQAFNDDLSHCTLTVFADMSDGTTVTNVVEIDNPPLWWPNGAGEQNFYEYAVAVNGEIVKGRIGLRKLEVLNEKTVSADGKDELSLVFRVNNRRLFMKGANWIPCDAYESRQTPERYRDLLTSAAKANMNMLRVWGGGQYEHEVFYNLCDELGILLWHDMMCSCAVYPGEGVLMDEIAAELKHQLRRLRDHASIALWCGDNECLGAIKWFDETKDDQDYYRTQWIKRSKLQGEMVAEFDPTRTYWPSSPCCGPGDFGDGWKTDSKGDMHNWMVWHDNQPFAAYYAYTPRFCSEFGYQSFPSMEVAETFATKNEILARDTAFEWHQKNQGGNARIRETMARYFPPAKDVPSELLLSQFQHGMAMKMACDGWRAQRPRCMGTLFWQLNDNWPVASWSSIEYGGKWKSVQHLARRFYAPIAVVAQPTIRGGNAEVTKGKIVALNDTAERQAASLRIEYWTYDGRIVASEERSVVLPPDSATTVGTFAKTADGTFLVLTLKTADGVYQNDWHFDFYRKVPLNEAKVTAKVDAVRRTVTLSTDRPAFFVWANARGIRGEFTDNAFTLLPGRPREIAFEAKEQVSDERFLSAFSVTHLAEVCILK